MLNPVKIKNAFLCWTFSASSPDGDILIEDNSHVVIPLMVFVFGFPILVISVLCLIQKRNKCLQKRERIIHRQSLRKSSMYGTVPEVKEDHTQLIGTVSSCSQITWYIVMMNSVSPIRNQRSWFKSSQQVCSPRNLQRCLNAVRYNLVDIAPY